MTEDLRRIDDKKGTLENNNLGAKIQKQTQNILKSLAAC